MNRQQYQQNRIRFHHAELTKYRGQWVAFSSDGQHILTGAEALESVEEQLAARGEDPQEVVLEYIPGPEGDISPDGAELL